MTNLTLDEIAHVIGLATAPAFLLGGVVTFLSVLITRLAHITDRVRALDDFDETDPKRARHAADLPRLRRRAGYIRAAMTFLLGSGLATALLIVIAFLGALLNFQSEVPVATLFVLGLLCFMAALGCLAREIVSGLHEFRHDL